MTVSTTTARISYSGNGSTVAFSVPFLFLSNTDVLAYLQNTTTGAIAQQVYTTQYTVTGAGVATGGTATFVTAPPSGYKVILVRATTQTQASDYLTNDALPADTLETNLDKLTLQAQENANKISRTVRLNDGDAATDMVLPPLQDLKGMLLGFDATTGEPQAVDPTGADESLFLGIPTEQTPLDGTERILLQTTADTGTATTRWAEIEDVLGAPMAQVDHIVDATLSVDQLERYNTNTGATGVITFTLPPGSANAYGYFGRVANHQVRLQPNGTESFINGEAGEFLAIMESGVIGIQWLDGYWQVIFEGPRIAYETPLSRQGEVWLEDDPQLDLTGSDAAATRLAALMTQAAADGLVIKGQEATLSIASAVTVSAPLHGPAFPRSSTQARLKLVPAFASTPITVTGASSSGGLIRLTVTSHGRSTGDSVYVADVGGVPAATGSWIASVINANTIDLLGSTFSGSFTSGGTLQYTPPVLDAVGVDGIDLEKLFVGDPGNISATSIASPSIAFRTGRPGRTPDTTYRVARYRLEDLQAYGVTVGFQMQGWSGTLARGYAQNCAVGFHIDTPNDCDLDLRAESCRQGFKIEHGDAVRLRALVEGSESNMVASTIDDCTALSGVIYLEHADNAATDYLLKIGSLEAVHCELVINCGALMSLTGGKVPILLDRVTGKVTIRGSAGSMHSLVQTTANTDCEINYVKELGVWPLEAASCSRNGPAYNYFPNSDLSGWVEGAAFPRGWNDAVVTGVTVSQRDSADGHDVRRGRYAMRLTASATGVASRKVEFWIAGTGSPTCLALRGKTVITGAWVWIPNTAEFAESDLGNQHCNVILNTYSYNGSATVNGSMLSGDYSHHTVRAGWNFLWTETAVQTDCTRLVVEVYLSTSGAPVGVTTAADAYLDIGSIQIAESSVPFNEFRQGMLPDAPHIDATFVGGRALILTDTAVGSLDTTQYFGVGDVVQKLTPASGAAWRSVCTTAGLGGTATWKTEAALS